MLSKLKMVGDWFNSEPSSAWDFQEVEFDSKTQAMLSSLSRPNRKIEAYGYTARVVLSGNSGNHCYIPSQYFIYALKLRPFLTLLNNFQKILLALGTEVTDESKKHTIKVLRSRDKTSTAITQLDGYSQEQFFSIFEADSTSRLNAKAFIKDDTDHRSPSDFFGSILLASIPVPNASSGTLADLLFSIAENEAVFQHLQQNFNHVLPWLFRHDDADELLFRVMSTFGWEGKLDDLRDAEPVSWNGIGDALLVRPIPESGNNRYMDIPVHYLTSCRKYVFLRKGLLDMTTLDDISGKIASYWPGMCLRFRDGQYYVESDKRAAIAGPIITGGTNTIFYGAPGTGKSHRVHRERCADADKFVTVFHADTQHADFVGALKPVTENGDVRYRFRPGPFTNAIIHALRYPDRPTSLVIEEINRASAAAVFGELFQLLDRNPDGESTYSIQAADPDMLLYINEALESNGLAPLDVLRIPANLSLLATMNSSDQAVMPLDTAFKRRWRFEYLPIDFGIAGISQTSITLTIATGQIQVTWPRFAKIINEVLVECDVAEDRLIGPFFLGIKELENEERARSALGGKLFIYLWDDVLRHHGHDRIFASTHKTFGALSAAFAEGKPVFSHAIEEKLAKNIVKADADSLGRVTDSPLDAAD